MAHPVEHGVRQAEMQRRDHLAGAALPTETEGAVTAAVAELLVDREDPTALELSLLRDVALCDLIVRRVVAEVDRRGSIFDVRGGLLPVFKSLATYMNTKRLHAAALGLRPDRTPKVPDLASYLAERATDASTAPPVLAAPAPLINADTEPPRTAPTSVDVVGRPHNLTTERGKPALPPPALRSVVESGE